MSARSRAALRALVARSGVVPGRGPADSVRTGTAGTAGPSNSAGSSRSAGSSDAGGGALTTQHVDAVVLAGGGALTVAGRAAAGIEVHDDFLPVDTQADVLLQMERARWSFTGGRPPNSFWHMDGLEAEPFFREHLFGLICERLGRTFAVQRIYANGQTALQQGAPRYVGPLRAPVRLTLGLYFSQNLRATCRLNRHAPSPRRHLREL